MHRSLLSAAVLVTGCQADSSPEDELTTTTQDLGGLQVTRTHVAGDVYHYGFVVPVGNGPNAQLHLHRVVRERAPWQPRRSDDAIMMMHGDFSTFATNFVPVLGGVPSSATGMATWLAERDLDVWGVDRRWAHAPAEADYSDFDGMGLDQELDDIGVALAFARGVRVATDASTARMTLSGFSRGGQLAYFYASREATRPAPLRHVKALVPIDVYASLAPEDEELRQSSCASAAWAYGELAGGVVGFTNDIQIITGQLALTAPGGTSPISPSRTNRGWMLRFVGTTYVFFPASPLYHLAAPVLEGTTVTGLRVTSEEVVARWLAGATPHQAMRESADTDALVCGDTPLPAEVPLSNIRVPLFLLGAAGGYGDHAIYSTTQVSSTDVTTHVIRQLPALREAEDYGHADLLFAVDAPALAWQPLLTWLVQH